MKNDSGKPDLSLISYELMVMLARVREFGNKKYEKNNWKKGFKVTRSLAAALRHIFQFLSGETYDQESGISHLGHAVASLEHAIHDMEHRPENDDREVTNDTNYGKTASLDSNQLHIDFIKRHNKSGAV